MVDASSIVLGESVEHDGSSSSMRGGARISGFCSVLDALTLGSTLSLRSNLRMGSSMSVLGDMKCGGAMSVMSFVTMGSSLSLRLSLIHI